MFAGHYNLLLGSGVSLDSKDRQGNEVMGATDLTNLLCQLKGVKLTTPLSKIVGLLSESEVTEHLTKRYHGCKPEPTVFHIEP